MKTQGWLFVELAHMYDRSGNFHTGPALELAMLMKTTGSKSRGQKDMLQISKIMNDPNLPKVKK